MRSSGVPPSVRRHFASWSSRRMYSARSGSVFATAVAYAMRGASSSGVAHTASYSASRLAMGERAQFGVVQVRVVDKRVEAVLELTLLQALERQLDGEDDVALVERELRERDLAIELEHAAE